MARKLIVEIIGDSSKLEKAFSRSSRSAKNFGRDMSRTMKVSTGLFGGLGRGVGLATGVLGVAGLTGAVRSMVDEFADAQKATAATAAVLQSTGSVAGVTADQVDKLASSISGYSGMDDEAVQAGENMLLTFTQIRDAAGKNNDIFTQATKVTADLAQFMGIDMARAALQVGKALNDPARGYARLQRIGVAFTKQQINQIKTSVRLGHVQDAQRVILAELNKEFGGQARAFGQTLPGKIARFQESLRNLGGQMIGVLAPAFTTLIDRALKWIQNTDNQQRVLAVFQRVVDITSRTVRGLGRMISYVVDTLGGWGNALTIVAGLFVGFKVAAVTSAQAALVANVAAAEGFAAAWRAALISTGWGVFAVAAGIAAAYVITHWEKVKAWFQEFRIWLASIGVEAALQFIEPFTHIPSFFGGLLGKTRDAAQAWKRDLTAALEEAQLEFADAEERAAKASGSIWDSLLKPPKMPKMPPLPKIPKTALPPVGDGDAAAVKKARDAAARLAQLRNQWFDAMIGRRLDRVQDIRSLQGQLAEYDAVARLIQQRINKTKDITRRLNLEDKLIDVRRQRREKAQEIAEAARAARDVRQFRLLGLGPEGEELVPNLESLRKRFARLQKRIKGTALDTAKTRRTFAQIGRAIADGIKHGMAEPVRQKIDEMFDSWADALKKGRDTFAKFKPIDATKFVKALGLDLTPAQTRRLIGAVAGISRTGTLPGARTPAFAGATGMVTIHNANFYGVQNMQQLENELHKRAKARPQTRRGAR